MTSIITKQSMIREHATVLLALFDSKKADGTPYPYTEMLTLVGLSSTHDWVRALSKFFTANGKRRKAEYTWKRSEIPAGDTLPGVLEEPQAQSEPEVTLQQILNLNQALWKINAALEEVQGAFDELCEKWYNMTGQEPVVGDD